MVVTQLIARLEYSAKAIRPAPSPQRDSFWMVSRNLRRRLAMAARERERDRAITPAAEGIPEKEKKRSRLSAPMLLSTDSTPLQHPAAFARRVRGALAISDCSVQSACADDIRCCHEAAAAGDQSLPRAHRPHLMAFSCRLRAVRLPVSMPLRAAPLALDDIYLSSCERCQYLTACRRTQHRPL